MHEKVSLIEREILLKYAHKNKAVKQDYGEKQPN